MYQAIHTRPGRQDQARRDNRNQNRPDRTKRLEQNRSCQTNQIKSDKSR